MRLHRVKIRGFGPFVDEQTLDLDELGEAKLVALCGKNGAGKSTLLELALPGAMYRSTPTRGSLKELAIARDALLEVTLSTDQTYTLRHLVDSVTGKGESVVLGADGAPVSGSTKVSDFDAWAAKHLPPPEVLLSSMFGAQQASGFLGAKPAERKAILLRTLGISRYEAWASAAGERARAAKQALEVTRARTEEAQRTGGDVEQLTAALEAALEQARLADEQVAEAREILSAREREAHEAAASIAALGQHRIRSDALRARLDSLGAKRKDIKARIAACQRTLSQADAIRAAAGQRERAQRKLDALLEQHAILTAGKQGAADLVHLSEERLADRTSERDRLLRRQGELEQVVAETAQFARAAADLEVTESKLEALRQAASECQAALDALTATTVRGAEERIDGLRTGLQAVLSEDILVAAHRNAREHLKDDDEAQRLAAEHPARVKAARQALSDALGAVRQAEQRRQELSALARRAGEGIGAKEQLTQIAGELERCAEAISRHTAGVREANEALRRCAEELRPLDDDRSQLESELQRLRPLAEQLPHIELAASKLEQRQEQLNEVLAEIGVAQVALEELGEPPEAQDCPDVSSYRHLAQAAEDRARRLHQAAAVAQSKLEAAKETATQLEALAAQQRAEEAELSDWTRLAEDLGRKGLQAAEIDGCGPELTALVNDLLHHSHGPRFTVRIDTQRLSSDGKKTLEGCQVTVLDTVGGREAEGATFSGGERVIISEALALGLSMLACQRSGLRGVTLVRDETGAALDPDNGEVYVKMLRRAAEQLDAHRVLFVCHSPELQELADGRVVIQDGHVIVERGMSVAA